MDETSCSTTRKPYQAPAVESDEPVKVTVLACAGATEACAGEPGGIQNS